MSVNVRYRISLSDYNAMCHVIARKKRFYRTRDVLFWLLVVANIAIPVWLLSALTTNQIKAQWMTLLLPNFAIAVGLIVFRYLLVPYVQRYTFNKQELSKNEVWLEVGKQGLRAKWAGIDSKYSWDSIQDIDYAPHHLFFWINKMQAIILPLRAFKNDAHQNEFLDFIPDNLGNTN